MTSAPPGRPPLEVISSNELGRRKVTSSPAVYLEHFVCKVVEKFCLFQAIDCFLCGLDSSSFLLLLLLRRRHKHHRQSLRPPSCQSGYAASLEQRQFISCHQGGMRSAAKNRRITASFYVCIYIFLDNGHVWDLIQKTPPAPPPKK